MDLSKTYDYLPGDLTIVKFKFYGISILSSEFLLHHLSSAINSVKLRLVYVRSFVELKMKVKELDHIDRTCFFIYKMI